MAQMGRANMNKAMGAASLTAQEITATLAQFSLTCLCFQIANIHDESIIEEESGFCGLIVFRYCHRNLQYGVGGGAAFAFGFKRRALLKELGLE